MELNIEDGQLIQKTFINETWRDNQILRITGVMKKHVFAKIEYGSDIHCISFKDLKEFYRNWPPDSQKSPQKGGFFIKLWNRLNMRLEWAFKK